MKNFVKRNLFFGAALASCLLFTPMAQAASPVTADLTAEASVDADASASLIRNELWLEWTNTGWDIVFQYATSQVIEINIGGPLTYGMDVPIPARTSRYKTYYLDPDLWIDLIDTYDNKYQYVIVKK